MRIFSRHQPCKWWRAAVRDLDRHHRSLLECSRRLSFYILRWRAVVTNASNCSDNHTWLLLIALRKSFFLWSQGNSTALSLIGLLTAHTKVDWKVPIRRWERHQLHLPPLRQSQRLGSRCNDQWVANTGDWSHQTALLTVDGFAICISRFTRFFQTNYDQQSQVVVRSVEEAV